MLLCQITVHCHLSAHRIDLSVILGESDSHCTLHVISIYKSIYLYI